LHMWRLRSGDTSCARHYCSAAEVLPADEVPKVKVYQIASNEKRRGISEAATFAAAAAVANANFATTGQRLRKLPFGDAQLTAK
jgi:CO/xanthine dehydrogenase Mo-binding subunit